MIPSTSSQLLKGVRILAFSGMVFMLPGCGPHYVATVPPAPVEVIPVAPYPNAVWVGGSYAWRRGQHVYVPGYYVRPRPGRVYTPGVWRQGPRGNYYVRGRWK